MKRLILKVRKCKKTVDVRYILLYSSVLLYTCLLRRKLQQDDNTQAAEPCAMVSFRDFLPVQQTCKVDPNNFPQPPTESAWRRMQVLERRHDRVFLIINNEVQLQGLHGMLQHLATLTNSLAILLNASSLFLDIDAWSGSYIDAPMLTPLEKTHEWWEYMLRSSALRINSVVRRRHLDQTLINVSAGIVHDPCSCSKFLQRSGTLKARHESCAVIMNSGLLGDLNGPRFGSAIDAHAAVFRINQGPCGGAYATVAGTKTTYRIIWPHSEVLRPFDGETIVFSVYYSSERHLLRDAVRKHRFRDTQQLIELPKAFRDCAKRCLRFPERHTSTGIVAVVLATTMCKRVAVFGKSLKVDSFNTSKFSYHYFEDNVPGKLNTEYFSDFHRPDLEEDFYKSVSSQGVTFLP